MFIDSGIVTGIYGDKPPLMKTRREEKIEKARKEWQDLITVGWQVTESKLLINQGAFLYSLLSNTYVFFPFFNFLFNKKSGPIVYFKNILQYGTQIQILHM